MHSDTVSHNIKSYSLDKSNLTIHTNVDTSKLKIHTDGLLGPDPFPEMSLQITYKGNRVYDILPYNNQGGYSYNCAYAIYKRNSTGATLFYDLGQDNANRAAQDFIGSIGPGSYYLQVTYFSGPIGNSDGSSYEQLGFTIYTPPTAPSGMICLYRYYNSTNGQHVCTSNWEEIGSLSNNFIFEKVIGYMYPSLSSASNLKPIYRYYNNATGAHYVTDVYGNFSPLVYEKILGYVGVSQSTSMSNGLDKWYSKTLDDHFNCVAPEVPLAQGYTKDSAFICGYLQ